jgi:hypothetical protein
MIRRRTATLAVLALVAGVFVVGLGPPAAGVINDGAIMVGGVVTGPGPGRGPTVRLFNASGTLADSINAYASGFQGGVFVASGDIDGDNQEFTGNSDDGAQNDEIITGAGAGGGPHVRAFGVESEGDHKTADIVNTPVSFFAYDPSFTGGVRVAAGDLTGGDREDDTCCGSPTREEVVTGPGPGGGPHIKVWSVRESSGLNTIHGQWMAFSPSFTGGVFVGTTMVQESGSAEDGVVLVGAGDNGASELRGFSGRGSMRFTAHMYTSSQNPGGAVKVAGRYAGPFWARVVTGTDEGGDPLVTVAGWSGGSGRQFLAYTPGFEGGVNVGSIDGPGGGIIVTGAGPGGGPHVKLFSRFHEVEGLEDGWMAYESSFRGGVNVAGGEFFCDPREGTCAFPEP